MPRIYRAQRSVGPQRDRLLLSVGWILFERGEGRWGLGSDLPHAPP
jgi:hypothetical protein